MAIRPIVLYPDPILRRRCRPVTRFDAELRRLAGDLVATLHAAPGLGLAAPQIGSDLRLLAVDLSVGEDPAALHLLVNPVLLATSGSQVDPEGCLSIPGLTERVRRPATVRLSAQGLDGSPFELAGSGLLARALCHELDHLTGYLRGPVARVAGGSPGGAPAPLRRSGESVVAAQPAMNRSA